MDDLDALGAQYREARDAIGEHRRIQATAEVTYGELANAIIRQHGQLVETPELVAARTAVDKAVADVEWCKAATVAAGEAFTGVPFTEAVARNEAHRTDIARLRNEAIDRLGD